MPLNRFYLFTMLLILAVLSYLNYQIFLPFLTAIAWAVVFCVVFYPVYASTLRFIKFKSIASLLTLLMILLVIIGPFSYLAFAIISETSEFIGKDGTGGADSLKAFLSDERVREIARRIQPYLSLKGMSVEQIIIDNANKMGMVIVDRLTSGFTNILSLTANFVFMSFTIFFLLKDGPGFFQKIRDYIPFSEQQKDRLATQVKDMIVSTIYGGVIVAVIQGILGGLAFVILGIGSPVIWGSIMAIASFIPMFGSSIVWGPASVMFFLQGSYVKGISMILIGIFVISMVDNILKPMIIGGRTKMPTVIIFFSVLGGIKLFGLLGLVLGPLVFALFLSVLEIFRTIEGGTNV